MPLSLDFPSVLEGEPHIVFAVDGYKIHQPAPKGGVESVHQVGVFEGSRKSSIVALRDCLLRMASSTASNLRYVEQFSEEAAYTPLTYADTLAMAEELAPLILTDPDDAKAMRFDALMYSIELAYLVGKTYKKVRGIADVANIPEVAKRLELLDKLLHTDYLDTTGINEFEYIREALRDLVKYIEHTGLIYITNFGDDLIDMKWGEAELENDDLQSYKAKAEFYVRQHQDHLVIAKLKTNQPLTRFEVVILENILWSEVGTKQDYEA